MPHKIKQGGVVVNIQSNLNNNSLELEFTEYVSAEAVPAFYKKTLYLNAKGEFDSSRIVFFSQDYLKISKAGIAELQLPGIKSPLGLQSDGTLILGEICTAKNLELKISGNIISLASISVGGLCLHGKQIIINEVIKVTEILQLQAEVSIQNHKGLQARNINMRGPSHLFNKGFIRATENLSVEARSIDNLGGMFAKVFKADLSLTRSTLSYNEPLSEGSFYIRNGGLMVSKDALSLNVSGKVINQGRSLICSFGDISIKTRHQFKNAISGQIFAKGRLFVRSSNRFINKGFLSGAENITLMAGKALQNAGVIQSFKALTIASEKNLENQASGKIIAETHMTIRSEDDLQNSGAIIAKGLISIHSRAHIQNGETGKILSNTTVKITGLGSLNNLGEITGHLQLSTQTLGDTLNGIAAKMVGCDLSISTLGDLHNLGDLHAEQSLKTKAKSIHNAKDAIFKSEGSAELQSYFVLMNSGKLLANNLLMMAESLINNLGTGEISALAKLSFNIQNQLNNHNVICSEGELIAHVKQLDNVKEGSITCKGKTEFFVTGMNNLGLIEASQLSLKRVISFCNSEGARLVAKKTLKAHSEGSIENQGEISSLGSLCLEANQKIENTLTGHIKAEQGIILKSNIAIKNAASIISKGDLSIITLQNFVNLAEGYIEANHIKAKANLISNQGKLLGKNTLRVEANLILDNLLQGLICAGEKLELLSTSRMENSGDINSCGELLLKASRILKNLKTGQISADSGLQLQAGHVLSNAGTVLGKKNVILEAEHYLSNEMVAKISAKGELCVKSEGVIQNTASMAGKEINVKAGLLFQTLAGSTLVAEETLKLLSNIAIENAGLLQADNIHMQSQLLNNLNNAKVVAKTQLKTHAVTMMNQGHFQSTDKFSIDSNILWNLSTGKISAKNLNVSAKRYFDNDGLMYGDEARIEGPILCNTGTLSALTVLSLKVADTFMHSTQGTLLSEQAIEISANNLHLLGRVTAKGNLDATVEKSFFYHTVGLWSGALLKLILKDKHGFNFTQPIDTPGSLNINLSHNMNIHTLIKTGRNCELSAADIQVQSGGIQANGNVQVKATDLLQTFRGTYLSGIEGLDLGATVIRSAGNLFTQANLRLQGSVLIENMGNIEVKGDAEIIAPLIQHGALGNVIQPSIFVAGNCRFQGNANIHDAQLKVGGTFKHGNLNVRSTEAEIRLAEEMRTNKKKSLRKKMRAICRMFISIPISYYTGGLFSGWLAGFGVGGVKLVAARGLVVGLSSSAIRGTNVVRGGLEGALFAGVGYGVTQVSFLKQQNEVIQEIARGMSVGALQTALHKGNLLENMVIAGLASGVGAALVPNLSADSGQSVRTDLNVLRAIVESSVATIASHSNKNLVINLASSAMGASFGQALSKIGNQQGYQAATKHKALPIVQSSNHTSNYKTPKPIQQRSKESPKLIQMKELLGLQTPKTPVGMVDNILQGRIKELEVAPKYKHQSTSSMGIKANQNIRDENSGQGFFPMWWRAIKGDQTQEVMNWQQRNIKRLPILNAMNEGIKKGTQISKMIVNARDAAFMPLLHPVDTVQGLAIFTWDMSGAASKLMFGSCTKGSSDRNSDRWRAIKQEYHQFDSGSLATKLEMINQVLLTGTLTMATGSVALLGVSNAVQITTRQGLKASQGMLKLYDANKVSQSLEFGAFKSGVLAETNFARNASVILSQKAVDKAPLIPAFDKFKSIPSVPVNKPLEQLAPKVHIKTKGIAEKQITDAGLSYPEPLLTHELPKVLSWQKHRNEYLKAQRELDVSGLPKKTQDLLIETSADNAIINRMLPDDIAGIFKEGRGVKIYSKINGRLLKHNMEGEQALRAIKTVIIDIKVRLKTLNDRRQINTIEVHLLEQKLSRLSKLKDNYSELMKDAKCLSGSNKLKP